MDDRGNFKFNPTEKEIKDEKLLELSEAEYKSLSIMDKKERKKFYAEKMGIEIKKPSKWGKKYFK